MGAGVVYVMTHDSIGLGEDGPTHQPVEHLAALRAIPGLYVYRPADAVETAECWALALHRRNAPSLLALTRQSLAAAAARADAPRICSAHGAYVLAEAEGARQVTLLATGSEVSIAMEARERSPKDGIARRGRVDAVLGIVRGPARRNTATRSSARRRGSAVEAAVDFGWDRWLGPRGAFIGMHGFGASAPGEALYQHFGITPKRLLKPPARSYRFDEILRRSEP